MSEELVPSSVHTGLTTVTGFQKGRSKAHETEPVKPVEDSVVDAIQPYVTRQVWAMIELQRLTGMRPGEVVLMRTADIDRSGAVWLYTPHYHKTEHHDVDREIPIGPRAQDVLKPWLKADPAAYLFSAAEAREEQYAAMRAKRRTRVQPSQRDRRNGKKRRPGTRYTTSSYGGAVWRACARTFPHPTLWW